MSKTWQHIILIVSLITSVMGFTFWSIIMWHGFFYKALAVSILLWMILIRDLVNGAMKSTATIGMWFAINNLLDELFFDPKSIQFNEYLFALIVVIIVIRKSKKTCQKNFTRSL